MFRTWMFVPGSDGKKLGKAEQLASDVIIFDLEDAVAPNEKDAARELVKQAVGQSGQLAFVRVNDMNSPFFYADVQVLAQAGLKGFVLPKTESGEQVSWLDGLLTQLEKMRGLPAGGLDIVPMVESARGLHHAFEIASASPRVRRIAFGSVDFALDINARLTKEGTEILYARSQLVIASRAAGIEPPIDTVFVDIKDVEGLERETAFAKQLGFQGKLVIHPAQIAAVNAVFEPTVEEVQEARAIVEAFEEAASRGIGVVQVKGKMVDLPVVERAKKTLKAAEALSKS